MVLVVFLFSQPLYHKSTTALYHNKSAAALHQGVPHPETLPLLRYDSQDSELIHFLAGTKTWQEDLPSMAMAGRSTGNPPLRHKPPPAPASHGVPHAVMHTAPYPANPANMSDTKAKTVLKEAVDAVVNSFAKHTHGYGRGEQFT